LIAVGGIWTAPLVDRIDKIVLFKPLDGSVVREILDGLIEQRRKVAARDLPAALDLPEVREQIAGWATEGEGTASARRLERALLRWLSENAFVPQDVLIDVR
jgi:ATP-dependent Clp protease ATP-binding subunit ClpA